VIETLQVEESVEVHDAPKLLVEWSSPWREFVGSIRPALARSERRLAGEAPFGLIPVRIMVPSYFLEAFLIFAAIVVQVKIAELRPYVAPRFSSHDVIYYSGDELPRTEDLGGAQAGTTGRAGGNEAHHRTQTIKIARGGSLSEKVVDAPNLKLPSSRDAVANLLAIRPNAGPPPSEGLRSNRAAPNLGTPLIAPAPNVIRDFTRNGVQLDSVIAPAPSVSRDRPLTALNLSVSPIAPAPNVASDHTLVAPALVPAVVPPAPSVRRDPMVPPSLSASVVAPAPSVDRDRTRSAATLAANVIPPAPGGVSRELSSSPVQMTNAAVIPPPVSAPERATTRNPKLSLSAPTVIAPPPSAEVSQDLHRLASGSIPDSSKTVVPPPPTQSGSGSFMSSLIGKVFGPTEVVPPPPAVHSNGPSGGAGTSLAANVVPPPPPVSTTATGGNPRGNRNGTGASLGTNVVAPPPSSGVSGGTGTRSLASTTAPTLGAPSVVPPPPSLSGAGGGTGNTGGGAGTPSGTSLANNIVPPPPSIGGGSAPSGSGLGRRGAGLGAPLDAGAGLAPANNGGSGANAGAVISSQPGPKVGLPSSGGSGSLAMSPTGGDKPGLGGSAGGASIGRGNGPGSGMNGAGPGAGKTNTGHGSDPSSRAGISPAAGPGGAGNVPSGTPAVRGVDISGGSSQITLPSFRSDGSASDPQSPAHSPARQRPALGVTVVATATSGGAFEPYKNLLRGEKYTTYLDTSVGTVVMEFADEAATSHPYGATLTAPNGIRTDLADGLPHARMVVACTLDVSGNLKNVRVLEAGPADMTAKILSALRNWKFEPAMRGTQPVEVTAILGFGVDTNDRF
jgi:TonB family protein